MRVRLKHFMTQSAIITLAVSSVQCSSRAGLREDTVVGEWEYSSPEMLRRLPARVHHASILVLNKDRTAAYRFLPGEWKIEKGAVIFSTKEALSMQKIFHPENVFRGTFSIPFVYDEAHRTLTSWDIRDSAPDDSKQLRRKS